VRSLAVTAEMVALLLAIIFPFGHEVEPRSLCGYAAVS
jgi:hypothetical protein